MFDDESRALILKLADEFGVEPAALMAIIQVESGGRFYAKIDGKREPLIRFEGHYFDRLLPATAREKAVHLGLANSKAGKVANPQRQADRWKLLNRAIEIDRSAALSSCSWGVGQIMGAHWKWLGYGSVDALVTQARSGLAGQIELMARYIEKAGLIKVLQSRDWATFARNYNGPAYAKYGYDRKMAAAFERHNRAVMHQKPPRSVKAAPPTGRQKEGKSRMRRSFRSRLLSIFKWFN